MNQIEADYHQGINKNYTKKKKVKITTDINGRKFQNVFRFGNAN